MIQTLLVYGSLFLVVLVWSAILIPALFRSWRGSGILVLIVLIVAIAAAAVLPVGLDPTAYHASTGSISPVASNLSRAGQLTLLALGAMAVVSLLFRRERLNSFFIAICGYYLLLCLATVLAGQDLLLPMTSLLTVVASGSTHISLAGCVKIFRFLLRLVVAGSVVLWVVSPALASFSSDGTPRVLAGVTQLVGLAAHPNVLGPVAAVALVVEIAFFPTSRRSSLIFGAGALLVVIFAQSRSGWLMALIGVGGLWALGRRPGGHRVWRFWLAGSATIAAGVALIFGNPAIDWQALSTGRTVIWESLWNYYSDSPVIGNGAAVLSEANRGRLGYLAGAVGQAHNQFLQTLLESGVLGLLLLVTVIVVGLVQLRRSASPMKGFVGILALMLLVLMLSESPLRPVLNAYLVLTSFVVALFVALGNEQRGSDQISHVRPHCSGMDRGSYVRTST